MPPRRRASPARRRSPRFAASDGATDPPTQQLALPFGKSILPALLSADKMPSVLQGIACCVATFGLLLLPWLPAMLMALGADGGWDHNHYAKHSTVRLVREALGVTEVQLLVSASITAAVYGVLIILDILSECAPSIRWPSSWHCENTLCYDQMFCEPMRAKALLRRPGNTLSNMIYLFTALLILSSCRASPFALADGLFATMLLLLAIFSTLWHSSHAPKVHYMDLWAMDSCIVYLVVRILCAGSRGALVAAGIAGGEARLVAALLCTLIYGIIVLLLGRKQRADSAAAFLDGPNGCPLSGRNRLLGTSLLGAPSVVEAAMFAGLPVVLMALPSLVMGTLGSIGSATALTLMLCSLVVGWGYRMSERFFLDGCAPMNLVHALQRCACVDGASLASRGGAFANVGQRLVSLVLTTLAALVSPTQILHTFTGVTLLFGYVHARSLDDVVAQR